MEGGRGASPEHNAVASDAMLRPNDGKPCTAATAGFIRPKGVGFAFYRTVGRRRTRAAGAGVGNLPHVSRIGSPILAL